MAQKIDLKGVLTRIKAKYSSKDSAFEFFIRNASRLGVLNADERKKFIDLRGEKTPSTAVSPYLSYCDFGGDGVKHDVIYLIQEKYGVNFPEAVKMLAEWDNEPLDKVPDFVPTLIYDKKEEVNPYRDSYLKKMKELSFKKKDIFKELIDGLCRSCSLEEKRKAVKLFDIGLNEYENKETGESMYRLFIPEYNHAKIPYGSFRYNRSLDPKGLLRKNAKRVLFGSHLMSKFSPNKHIVFTEGHSDCIVNNAKGIAAVTSGSSTTKIGEGLDLLKGKEIHFYPDCDLAGLKGISSKIMEIEAFNASQDPENRIIYKVFWWAENFQDKEGKVFTKRDMIKEQIELFKKNKVHVPDQAKMKNWHIVIRSVKSVKQGFDFIDFFEMTKDSPNLKKVYK